MSSADDVDRPARVGKCKEHLNMKRNVKAITAESVPDVPELETIYTRVSAILDEARKQTVRSINTLMVTAY